MLQPGSYGSFPGHLEQQTGLDEGVHENDETFDDTTLVMEDGQEEIDLNNDSDHDPLERPPEPTVPDERVSSDDEGTTTSDQKKFSSKDETTRKISSLLSELVCENRDTMQPDLVPIR